MQRLRYESYCTWILLRPRKSFCSFPKGSKLLSSRRRFSSRWRASKEFCLAKEFSPITLILLWSNTNSCKICRPSSPSMWLISLPVTPKSKVDREKMQWTNGQLKIIKWTNISEYLYPLVSPEHTTEYQIMIMDTYHLHWLWYLMFLFMKYLWINTGFIWSAIESCLYFCEIYWAT